MGDGCQATTLLDRQPLLQLLLEEKLHDPGSLTVLVETGFRGRPDRFAAQPGPFQEVTSLLGSPLKRSPLYCLTL